MKNSTMKFVFDGYKMININDLNKESNYETLCMAKECKETQNNKLHPLMGIFYTVALASSVCFAIQLLPIIATAISTTVLTMPIPVATPIILI